MLSTLQGRNYFILIIIDSKIDRLIDKYIYLCMKQFVMQNKNSNIILMWVYQFYIYIYMPNKEYQTQLFCLWVD